MSDLITITTETFEKLSSPISSPVAFIVRQVGDGPVDSYQLTRNGEIRVDHDIKPEPESMVARSLRSARTNATMTGAIGGNWIEQDGRKEFSVAASWVREGSTADLPVVVEQEA